MTRARENADLPVAMTESGGQVGLNTSSALGTLHIKTSDSGVTSVGTGGDELIIENQQTAGMSLLSGSTYDGNILFGDTGSNVAGYIQYKHNGDALAFGTQATERMRINASGHVTMPNQPMFSSTITNGGVAAQGDVFAGRTISNDFTMQGFTFNSSNGRFTCPVSGKYLVSFYSIQHTAEGYVQIRKNDNAQFYAYSQSGTAKWRTYSALGIISLAANDYLTFVAMATAASSNFHGQQHMRAVAYLIG